MTFGSKRKTSERSIAHIPIVYYICRLAATTVPGVYTVGTWSPPLYFTQTWITREIVENLRKISSLQLYRLWKNLSIGLLVYIVLIACTRLLPFFMAPILALGACLLLYTVIYNHRKREDHNCLVTLYAFFCCLMVYCIVSILVNTAYAWGLILVPDELIFFNDPYIPSLVIMPLSFLTMLVIYLRRNKLMICKECRLRNGDKWERGLFGLILDHETRIQLVNLVWLFGGISAIVWTYYLAVYVNTNVNDKDWYVFLWLNIAGCLLDEVYFAYRFANLYMDLKEANELITQEELRDMTAKTYMRFYVVCKNQLYVDTHAIDMATTPREVIDTPFQTSRAVNGMSLPEIKNFVEKRTGVPGGDLIFFFGRRSPHLERQSMLRYFYFLPGSPEDYPVLHAPGQWLTMPRLKEIYNNTPSRLGSTLVADITRLATILVTQKKFKEDGSLKVNLKTYQPSFTLEEVKTSGLDFQDDKWIRVSMFNEQTPFFRVKKWWKSVKGHYSPTSDNHRGIH